MAAKKDDTKQTIEVRGFKFDVDTEFAQSWAAVKLYRKFNDDDVALFDKLDLSFELIELATGRTEDEIVEMAGGENAPATEIVNFAAELVKAIDPKN